MKLVLVICLSVNAWAAEPFRPFRIAALYPQSMAGHFNCTCGLEAKCLTKAVVDEAKRQGLNVSIELFDNGRDPFTTARVSKEVAEGEYDAAVGTLVSAEALIASKIFEKAKVPFIAPTASNPEVTSGKTYVIRTAFNDYRQAELLARLTVKDLRASSVAIIQNAENQYSDFLGNEYKSQLQKIGITNIAQHSIVDGYADFKPIVEKIVKDHTQVVFVPLSQQLIAGLYGELVRKHATTILLGSDIVEGEVQFLKMLGKNQGGVRFIFVKHWNGKVEGAAGKRYAHLRDTYCKEFTPTMTGAAAFDAITLLLETLKKYPGTTRENLIPRMRSVKYFGMTGPISYDKTNDPIKPLQLFTIEANRAKFWRMYQ